MSDESRTSAEEMALHDPSGEPGPPPTGVSGVRSQNVLRFLTRFGLLIMLAVIIAVFSFLEPSSFFTIANARSTASIAAPLFILAIALTVPLGLGEFDLSIANGAQLSAACLAWLISIASLPWLGAIGIVLAGAVVGGLLIGFIVVKSQVNAFIITLGAGTIFAGIEFGIMRGTTLYSGIPAGFTEISVGRTFGVPNAVLVAVVFAIVVWVGMERTVVGRKMRAAGANAEAARLSGVRVEWLRAVGFSVAAIGGAVAATVLVAQSASYYPNSATGLLLPIYAACFLGTTAFRPNIFDVPGTAVGAVFLAVIQSGLIMVGVQSWIAQVIQGSILIIAVVLARAASRRVL